MRERKSDRAVAVAVLAFGAAVRARAPRPARGADRAPQARTEAWRSEGMARAHYGARAVAGGRALARGAGQGRRRRALRAGGRAAARRIRARMDYAVGSPGSMIGPPVCIVLNKSHVRVHMKIPRRQNARICRTR